jgi:YfiH family protein
MAGAPVVAAVHAGWRGVVAGVIPAAIDVMAGRGVKASDLRAAIGPAIDPCCFEVGSEVAETLARAVRRREIIVDRGEGAKPHVDLRAASRWVLIDSGVRPEHIEIVGPCTRCSAELFHSYRREGGGVGRQFSVISIASP